LIITRRKRATALVAAFGAVTGLTTVTALTASASHPEASLPGSNFEIDVDANLKQDDPAPSIDWASVTEIRGIDLPTPTRAVSKRTPCVPVRSPARSPTTSPIC
jgi:hypothetical protein